MLWVSPLRAMMTDCVCNLGAQRGVGKPNGWGYSFCRWFRGCIAIVNRARIWSFGDRSRQVFVQEPARPKQQWRSCGPHHQPVQRSRTPRTNSGPASGFCPPWVTSLWWRAKEPFETKLRSFQGLQVQCGAACFRTAGISKATTLFQRCSCQGVRNWQKSKRITRQLATELMMKFCRWKGSARPELYSYWIFVLLAICKT